MRNLDLTLEKDRILAFMREYLQNAGIERMIVGLSGGVDSSVTVALAVEALGKDKVTGVMMPYKTSHPDSLADARLLAEQLGIKYSVVDITPMTDAYFATYQPEAEALRRGNWMARTRMCVLYDLSAKIPALVAGTSNRTELLVGYFTQFGDSACALEPIGHLYKTEVWELAKLLSVPDKIISKPPTADLWQGQTDEGELGISYAVLDEILYDLTELDLNANDSTTLRFSKELYQKVAHLVERSAFKRQMPPVPELL